MVILLYCYIVAGWLKQQRAAHWLGSPLFSGGLAPQAGVLFLYYRNVVVVRIQFNLHIAVAVVPVLGYLYGVEVAF